MTTRLIGTRIRALREERKLSQDDLARVFGFKDRQTVSAIETGERRVSAAELLTAIEKLGASLDYFTDPFLLVGEGKFSWRQSNVALERLAAFERVAGRWIAANRTLAPQVGRPASYLRHALKLTSKSSFEDAMAAGERFAADFDLGPVPGKRLADVMERKLGILVLMMDAIFASAVLMPTAALDRFGPVEGEIIAWLNATADALQVTATALKWRLVALDRLDLARAKEIPDAALRNNGRADAAGEPPPLFSKPFMEVIALAVTNGQVSARRAADLLDMTLEDLVDLCATYGLEAPFDL